MISKSYNNYQNNQVYQPSQNYQQYQPSKNYQIHQHSQNYQQYHPSQNNNQIHQSSHQVFQPNQDNQMYQPSQNNNQAYQLSQNNNQVYKPIQNNHQLYQPSQNYQQYQHSQNYQIYQQPSQNNQVYRPSQKYQVYQQHSQNYIPSQSYQTSQNYQTHLNYSRQPQVDNVPGLPFEDLDPCLLNVAKSVCKIRIDTNYGSFVGSGFFLKFLINGQFFNWLVTNEHVITKEMINNKNIIQVWYNVEDNNINIKLDPNERYIKTFKEHRVDATAIQIIPKDDIYKDYFLEPELGYDNNSLVGKEIFIPQFPGFKQIKNARGKIKQIDDGSSNEFTHLAKTQKGSSGSPIFLKGNKKVIGIHKEGSIAKKENYGDFIAPIISILTFDIMFNKMKVNNNVFLNLQNNFGQEYPNPNNNSNIIGAVNPNNQLNPLNQINKNMMNNNIIAPGNNLLKSKKSNESEERYVGQLVNGKRQGLGTIYNKDNGKLKFEGVFVNGLKHGKGKEYYENGEIKYEGIFINGIFHEGKVKLYYNNGNIYYEGGFKNGKYEGKGKLYDENGKFRYEGDFRNGLYEGKGKENNENGETKYEGFFKNGQYDGKGKLYCNESEKYILYDGDFKNGKYEGKGIEYYDEKY